MDFQNLSFHFFLSKYIFRLFFFNILKNLVKNKLCISIDFEQIVNKASYQTYLEHVVQIKLPQKVIYNIHLIQKEPKYTT